MGVQPPADMPLLHCPCDDKGCHGFTILDLVYTRAKDSGFGEVSKLEYSDTLTNYYSVDMKTGFWIQASVCTG